MKAIISLLLALTATLILAFSAIGAGEADWPAGPRAYLGAEAKIEYCEDCHGRSGRGYLGFLAMPRLAGQTTAYLENQLLAFAERRRDSALFINMARVHGLGQSQRAAVVSHFARANPAPFGGAPRHLIGAGKRIYDDGVPEANIPACTACHGPDGKGQGPNPRLAGQLYPYVVARLSNWRSEHSYEAPSLDRSVTMTRIAHNLSRSQMSAIAAYVSQLK